MLKKILVDRISCDVDMKHDTKISVGIAGYLRLELVGKLGNVLGERQPGGECVGFCGRAREGRRHACWARLVTDDR